MQFVCHGKWLVLSDGIGVLAKKQGGRTGPVFAAGAEHDYGPEQRSGWALTVVIRQGWGAGYLYKKDTMPTDISLCTKYNVPAPRYTSYPTVPFWNDGVDVRQWRKVVAERVKLATAGEAEAADEGEAVGEGMSIYIHLPFCESLCTYCGCTKKITCNHSVEDTYIDAVLNEWEAYRALMSAPPLIREIHLGGGTPTFFSAANLVRLVSGILGGAVVHADRVFSIEGHPNNTTREHLDALASLGFTRISYGVQDTDPGVQEAIGRLQPFEHVQRATRDARAAGFTSVNFDLIYGLPRQNADSLLRSIAQCLTLRPDRIAFYSYAHLPSPHNHQRLINEQELPEPVEKLNLYLRGKELFLGQGYTDIGMDHFALPTDDLYRAWIGGTLHRNFMGYTSQRTDLLLGLGMSAISDAGVAYAQNTKSLTNYYRLTSIRELPVMRGYFLTDEDRVFQQHILDIACRDRTTWPIGYQPAMYEFVMPALRPLAADGLVLLEPDGLVVTLKGRAFIRNICRAFDLHLMRRDGERPIFSKAI